MLQELTEYFNSIKKTQAAMKVALYEIKKNLQGTKSEGKKARIHINDLEHKEEIHIQSEQKEGTLPLAPLSASFQSLPPLPTIKLGPSGADSQVGGLVYFLGPYWSLQ